MFSINTTANVAENNTTPVADVASCDHIQQHSLMKQVPILNKQFALYRANQVVNQKTAHTVPLYNILFQTKRQVCCLKHLQKLHQIKKKLHKYYYYYLG